MKGDASARPGAAYVFKRTGSTWTEQAVLTASDGANGDGFGNAVALSPDGGTALIGADGKAVDSNARQGAAYVFMVNGSTWTEQAKLTASSGYVDDHFGTGVSLSADGSTALVGAPTTGWVGYDPGASYVFTRSGTTWTEQAKLVASDGESGDTFGQSTALSGDGNTAFVGGCESGNVYVFTRSGSAWTEWSELEGSPSFGCSLSSSPDGNTLLVGQYGGKGMAFLYGRSDSTWELQQEFTPSDSDWWDSFGSSVSLSSDGSTVLIGAYQREVTVSVNSGEIAEVTNSQQGVAYVFRQIGSTWQELKLSLGASGQASDWFGYAVALSADGSSGIVTKSNIRRDPLVGYSYDVNEP